MTTQFAKPLGKQHAGKNDRNDAAGIATAVRQSNMRFVPIKTVEQRTRLNWHRMREGYEPQALATSYAGCWPSFAW